jgi:voltage-gated potassium channel
MERTATQVPYLVFTLGLSILALGLLGGEAILKPDQETRVIIDYADFAICILFFLDFVITFWRSENRVRYLLTWGWLDLLSSIPMIDALRWGRTARIVRILRILRGVRATRILAAFILERRAQSGLLAAALVSVVLVVFASVAVLHFERDEGENANIKGPEDALWWAVATITTVGYGDRFPVSPEGRIVATFLMTAGVGLFGTSSGFVAAWFLAPAREKQESELQLLRAEIGELRRARVACPSDGSLWSVVSGPAETSPDEEEAALMAVLPDELRPWPDLRS